MKRLLCLALTVLLVFSLAACKTRVEEKPLAGRELWEQAKALQDAYDSTVYTMKVLADVKVGDLMEYDTTLDMKVEGADLQSDNPLYRITQKTLGEEETYTYVGGTAYADLMIGLYKQKMTPEAFGAIVLSDQEETNSSDFTAEDFGKVEIAKENEKGYTLVFSEPSKNFFDGVLETKSPIENIATTFTGEIQLDAEGNYQSLSADASFTGTMEEQTVEMTMKFVITMESFNQSVVIGTPAGTSSFVETDNLKGIATVSKALITQNGAPSANLHKLVSFEMSDGQHSTKVQMESALSYLLNELPSLFLAQQVTQDGKVITTLEESYEKGAHSLVVNGEAQEQRVSETDVRTYIHDFPREGLEGIYNASDFSVTEKAGTYTFAVIPDRDYCIESVSQLAELMFGKEIGLGLSTATDWNFTERTLSLTVAADQEGVTIASTFVATVTVGNESLKITVQHTMAPMTDKDSSAA